jgi:hypothetical protein
MRFASWPGHRRSWPSSHSRTMLFLAVLLVMVLAPIGGQIATAGEEASAQVTEEPETVDPTEEPAEGVEAEPTAEPTSVAGNDLLGSICTTETFVSDIECEIEPDEAGFDLLHWNGDDWQDMASGTTDGSGILRFTGLDAGEYWLDEQGAAGAGWPRTTSPVPATG